jgi:hypothetical protein
MTTINRTLHRTAHSSLIAGALLLTACGNATLDLVDEPQVPPAPVVEADVCDEHPELLSPVKVLFLVDISGSLQFTDAGGERFRALRELVLRLADEGAYVATMAFGSSVHVESPPWLGQSMFEPARQWVEPEFLHLADVQTDLEGALTAARMYLTADILHTDLNERARTRYVTVLFTDGKPTPVCCVEGAERDEPVAEFGCALDPWDAPEEGVATTYCGASPEPAMCNDQALIDSFRESNASDDAFDYGDGPLQPLDGLFAGGNYNRPGSLQDAARLIGALTQEGVGAVSLHAFTLFDPTLPASVMEIFGLNACQTQRTLEALAEPVAGTTELFSSSLAIDFSSVDTTPLCD